MSLSKPSRRKLLEAGVSGGSGAGLVAAAWTVAYVLVMHRIVPGLIELLMLTVCAAVAYGCSRRLRVLADQPHPDYSRIASMERDVWGEVFEHAGAPRTPRPVSSDDAVMRMLSGARFGPDSSVILPSGRRVSGAEVKAQRTHCLRCGSPEVRAAGRCPRCYRRWKLERLGERK